jgi:hypothetical protein
MAGQASLTPTTASVSGKPRPRTPSCTSRILLLPLQRLWIWSVRTKGIAIWCRFVEGFVISQPWVRPVSHDFFWPLRYFTWLIVTIRPLARKAKWNVDPPALRASACLSIFWWTATGTGSACSPFFESENDRQRLSGTVCDVIARVDTRHYGLVWWFPLLFLTIACTAWRHASKPAS